jgi:hypothetical protein
MEADLDRHNTNTLVATNFCLNIKVKLTITISISFKNIKVLVEHTYDFTSGNEFLHKYDDKAKGHISKVKYWVR